MTTEALDRVQRVVDTTEQHIEQTVAPIRRNLLQRFPIISLLLATFGVTATMLGIERMLLQYEVLQEHPFIVLLLGIAALMLTGALYKKLG